MVWWVTVYYDLTVIYFVSSYSSLYSCIKVFNKIIFLTWYLLSCLLVTIFSICRHTWITERFQIFLPHVFNISSCIGRVWSGTLGGYSGVFRIPQGGQFHGSERRKSLPSGVQGQNPSNKDDFCLGWTQVTDSQFGSNRAYLLTVSVIWICLFHKLVTSQPQESEWIRTEY